jgi:hypothetical protein
VKRQHHINLFIAREIFNILDDKAHTDEAELTRGGLAP